MSWQKSFEKTLAHNQKNPEARKSLTMTYHKQSTKRVVKRSVSPYEVKNGLLYAYDHKRKALRTFKVDRIKHMEKQAFWQGFEKRAVSEKWINNKVINGLVSRASKLKDSLPQTLRGAELNAKGFGFTPASKKHWRQAQPSAMRDAHRHYIGQLNAATKGKPKAAQKAVDGMHDLFTKKKWYY